MRISALLLLFFLCSVTSAQKKGTPCEANCTCSISGTIVDAQTEEPIPFVTVQVSGTSRGAITGEDGKFTLSELCQSEFDIIIKHIGYKPVTHHHDSYHGSPVIQLAPDEVILESVVVEDEQYTTGLSSMTERKLSGKELSAVSNQSLAEAMTNITGVSTLKTGNNIVKPIIHGLHSNRILIINNGIRHENQDWGEAHAPEIDPALAGNLSLIKGAAAVKYGPNALGGVIIVSPPKMQLDDHFHGEARVQGESNGRAVDGSLLLQKGYKNFAWLVQAAGRYQGDLKAPDYNLTNTGMREFSIAGGFLYHWKNLDLKLYYSHVEQELGVLRGSVIGNLSDLSDAIAAEKPEFTREFDYEINTPKQEVSHDLLKLEGNFNWENSQLNFLYGFQINRRKEFDVRRGSNNERPSIDLELFTHTLEAEWLHPDVGSWSGSVGAQLLYQDNNNLPGTNTIPFVPNYNNSQFGLYLTESKELNNKMVVELGVRYDVLAASARLRDTDNEIVSFDQNYQSVSGIAGVTTSLSANSTFRINVASAWRAPNIAELFSFGKHRSNLQYGFYRYTASDFPSNEITVSEKVENELGYKLTASYEYAKNNFRVEITPFLNYIDNYIYAEPRDVLQTVRGSFPAFAFVRTDALFAGIDAAAVVDHSSSFSSKIMGTFLWAKDLDKDAVLFGVPANKLSYKITHQRKIKAHPWEIAVQTDYTFEQFRAPRVIAAEQFVENDEFDPFENDTSPFDFKAAPDGYLFMTLSTEINIRQWVAGMKIINLLNSSYREYTDMLRYFADQPSINFQISLKYQL